MNKHIIATACLSMTFLVAAGRCQDIEARNKIDVTVKATVLQEKTGLFSFGYVVHSSLSSRQQVWDFRVIFRFDPRLLDSVSTPDRWQEPMIPVEGPPFWVAWVALREQKLKPGESKEGFFLETGVLPGVTEFYAEGYAPPPNFPEGMAEDSIPGYDDLTPYGPGVVGKTVGPVLPPDPFVAADFLDTLASYKHQAAALRWVGQEGFLNQLDEKLDQARDQLAKGHTKQARDKVEEFVKKLEHEAKKTEKDQDKKNDKKWVTSEGYALLKFNAEYLIEKLEEQITKKK
ncbi:MAG: hypothetical protein FJY85_15015 [Deltaproteobacteria bacterium]|nr:hypothetical protein [Deltaproteobacteria bacterium]